jgi:hypothetical protein
MIECSGSSMVVAYRYLLDHEPSRRGLDDERGVVEVAARSPLQARGRDSKASHVVGSILGAPEPYVPAPYFFSDIGSLSIQQVAVTDAACEWREDDWLTVGLDSAGAAACVLLLNPGSPAGGSWAPGRHGRSASHHVLLEGNPVRTSDGRS